MDPTLRAILTYLYTEELAIDQKDQQIAALTARIVELEALVAANEGTPAPDAPTAQPTEAS
jgi:hypothetical protein